jgi:hypothetical protein
VSFAEDQDAVGQFGSGGQDESFGEAVRSRALRRDLDSVDPDASLWGSRSRPELVTCSDRRPTLQA